MFKKLFLTGLILLFTTSLAWAEWKFNPYTSKLDYYEAAGAGSGDLSGEK